jgi:hypothetical protein
MKKSHEELEQEKRWFFTYFIEHKTINSNSLNTVFNNQEHYIKVFIRLAQTYSAQGLINMWNDLGVVKYELYPTGQFYLEQLIKKIELEKTQAEIELNEREIKEKVDTSTLITNKKTIKSNNLALLIAFISLIVAIISLVNQNDSSEEKIQEINTKLEKLNRDTKLQIKKLEKENIKLESIQNTLLNDKKTN